MSESATRALVEYLIWKGLDVDLVTFPIINHKGVEILMFTRKLVNEMSTEDTFEAIFEDISSRSPEKVFIYVYKHDVLFTRSCEDDFVPFGAPKLFENKTVRYGVYPI